VVGENNYRCRVGHAWTGEALLAARDEEFEGALWVALRSLHEKSKLARAIAKNVGSGPLHDRYTKEADEAERAVAVLGERLSEAYGETGERGAG